MRKRIPIFTALAMSAPGAASAQTDDVIFNGTVADTCTVTADTNGTLALSAGGDVLASSEAGGAAGTATVVATSASFSVSIDAVTGFTTGPADADTNTVFATSYDASGATTATGVAGSTATALGSGTTSLSVDASATKSTGIFSAGTYSLTATVRCTP